jgi:hypothetical protein
MYGNVRKAHLAPFEHSAAFVDLGSAPTNVA